MGTMVEQIESITEMPKKKTTKKRTTSKPRTATSRPRILRSRKPPRLKKRSKK